jgi:hypothetical protein
MKKKERNKNIWPLKVILQAGQQLSKARRPMPY